MLWNIVEVWRSLKNQNAVPINLGGRVLFHQNFEVLKELMLEFFSTNETGLKNRAGAS